MCLKGKSISFLWLLLPKFQHPGEDTIAVVNSSELSKVGQCSTPWFIAWPFFLAVLALFYFRRRSSLSVCCQTHHSNEGAWVTETGSSGCFCYTHPSQVERPHCGCAEKILPYHIQYSYASANRASMVRQEIVQLDQGQFKQETGGSYEDSVIVVSVLLAKEIHLNNLR